MSLELFGGSHLRSWGVDLGFSGLSKKEPHWENREKGDRRRGRDQCRDGITWVRIFFFLIVFFFFFFFFLWPHLQHMEIPRLRVESELQLPAYTTATGTTQDLHLQPQLMAMLDP